MILIAGLGNPGVKYQNNRHNIGFMVADYLVGRYKATNASKSSFRGELFKSNNKLILKPMTFMNLSGESVRAVKEYYKCDEVFVIYDDLDLPFGTIRFKVGGSSGGHNGLKSCDANIGAGYYKVRLGIGRPPKEFDVVSYVLGDFSKKDQECVSLLAQKVEDALEEFFIGGFEKMASLHSIKKSICE